MRALSQTGRVILAASDRNEHVPGPVEDTSLQGYSSWLSDLMRKLEQGHSLSNAQSHAEAINKTLTVAESLLEENGDSLDDSENPQIANGLYLGFGYTPYRPQIAWIQPQQILSELQDQATLALTLDNASNLGGSPWALVVKPDGSTQTLVLQMDGVTGQYQQTLANITDTGRYDIHYYVRDQRGNLISDHKTGSLYKADSNNTSPFMTNLISPANGDQTSTLVLFKWQYLADPDGDEQSYNLIIRDNSGLEVFRVEQIDKTYYLLNENVLDDLSTYTWQVETVDERGGYSISAAFTFNTDNTNGIPGILSGIIYSDLDFSRLASASVSALLTTTSNTVISLTDGLGEYIVLINDLLVNVTGDKAGYLPASVNSVQLQPGLNTKLNLYLPEASNDTDNDGVNNELDNCPADANSLQEDLDNDGLGDACDNDSDNDGHEDDVDNCPLIPNNQVDTDGDGLGNACDNDDDGDGLTDSEEAALGTSRLLADTDDDGTNDNLDNCPVTPNDQADGDNDGIGDACDDDLDNDGLSNSEEASLGTNPNIADSDGDGYNDKEEVDAGTDPTDADDFPRRSKAWRAIIPLILNN